MSNVAQPYQSWPKSEPDFSSMTEDDVREEIVRPFLHRLGYRRGTAANIRTDVALRYDRIQLGRKNARDPELPGARKPDYVCDAISHGRFVVEAKAGHVVLTDEDAAQAYSYAAHPEISAFYFLVTNGREFRLYNYGNAATPVFVWTFGETDKHFAAIENILSPAAIQRRALRFMPDVNKPLAPGLGSIAEIVGGTLTYHEITASNPAFIGDDYISGARASVRGHRIFRSDNQLITGELEPVGPFETWNAMNKAVGWDKQVFSSADEFISTDEARPSIFQNVSRATIATGTRLKAMPNAPEMVMPFPMNVEVFTQGVGFFNGDVIVGTFENAYAMEIVWPNPVIAKLAAEKLPGVDGVIEMMGSGEFEVRVR